MFLVLLRCSMSKPLTETERLHFALDDIKWCHGEEPVFVVAVVKPYCNSMLNLLLKTVESSQLFLCPSVLRLASEVS